MPILFLLYVEPFLRISQSRFGYADDGCLLTTAKSLQECGQKLQQQLDQTTLWGQENGLIFDVKKTELQYFHKKRKYQEPPIYLGNATIRPNEYTRWLGVFFDRKLNFKDHVRRACQRSRVVTDHVKRLCNTVTGINPALLRQAIQATAFSALFFWRGNLVRTKNFSMVAESDTM